MRVGERSEDPLSRGLEVLRSLEPHARYGNAVTVPEVLFVCVHNAGRSQMAAALLERHAGERIRVRSAGSEPAEELNPAVVQAMREVGIDLDGRRPRRLEDQDVRKADVVVTMGCGDACPIYPGKRYEDWELDDPSGKSLAQVRPIREEIDRRVRDLVARLDS
jgi:arsenate reductase